MRTKQPPHDKTMPVKIRSWVVPRFLAAVFLVVGFVGAPLNAQVGSSAKPKRVGLIVTDKDGTLVSDLKKEELSVSVNGTSYPVFQLSKNTLPSVVVLSLDNSGSLRQHLKVLVDGAMEIAGSNDRKNLFLLMRFVGRDNVQITDRFSSDPAFLESKRNMFFIEGGQTAVIDAVHKAVQIVSGQNNLNQEYRKAVVVISDGEDRDSKTSIKELQELIGKENVQVYFVGLTELLSEESGFIGKSPVKKAKEFIEMVASESGGAAIFPKEKDILKAASSIRAMMNDQYILTLETTDQLPVGSRVQIDFAPNSKRKNVGLRYRPLIN
ncbi:MAG: VWA domain-containing protein [Acidobacteria bacterium]|nr:VWA domain-containing protein [Acidobacteriota bacterium]